MPIGGDMQATGEVSTTPEAAIDEDISLLEVSATFAVIHDEPYLSIVFDGGEFCGRLEDGTLEGLERARLIAAEYNLEIYHVRMDYYKGFMLKLREMEVVDS